MKLFKTKKEKEVEELTQIGIDMGCLSDYANICAKACVYEQDLDITNSEHILR